MLTRFYLSISRRARQFSTKQKVKLKVTMDEETFKRIENDELKARKHPGKMHTKLADLPSWLPAALEQALNDMPVSTIIADSIKLANYLNGRHPPAEQRVVEAKYMEIKAELAAKKSLEMGVEISVDDLNHNDKNQSVRLLKRAIHAWSPVQYNKYAGLLYLVSRSAQEYAVLYKIFHEITTRDKDFRPTTFMDFGSGVGTALWVTTQLWPNAVQEHMNIDSSPEMNDLSELIIAHAKPKVNKNFYRQYISLSNRTYDIVVSAYSLLELPNMQTRLDSVAKLWAKTARYLVIVEQGTNAGFRMISEARDFILHMQRSRNENNRLIGSVFSPCPHNLACPRYKTDNTPCNFEVAYKPLGLKNQSTPGVERYSYVVLKKGDLEDKTSNWPRIVRPTLLRSKHIICRLCTADGNLDEIIFTRTKHGKFMYRCAKASKWGDRLPIETAIDTMKEEIEEESIIGEQEEHKEEEDNEETEGNDKSEK